MSNEPPLPSPRPFDGPLFTPRSTTVFRVVIAGVLLAGVSTGYAVLQYYHSPYWNGLGLRRSQPVLFSHRHHAGELRIDCRYCHATVETSAFAGMPATATCLSCHSQLFTNTRMLQPVVTSAALGQPLRWARVNALPDHVYFDHSIHLAKGVGCTTCHGQVGQMPLMAKGETLTMRWCVDCHRDPGPRLRPRQELFAPTWSPPPAEARRAEALRREYQVHAQPLTNCSTCHH